MTPWEGKYDLEILCGAGITWLYWPVIFGDEEDYYGYHSILSSLSILARSTCFSRSLSSFVSHILIRVCSG